MKRNLKKMGKVAGLLLTGLFVSFANPTIGAYAAANADGSVTVNAENFPDATFREYVKTLSGGSDGVFTKSELNAITTVNVNSKGISSMKGIEYFTSLKELRVSSNNLTELDLTKNTALEILTCASNKLSILDLSKNTALTSLNCENNLLHTLDLSNNKNLSVIKINANRLLSLDLSSLPISKLFFPSFDKQIIGLGVLGENGFAIKDIDPNVNYNTIKNVSGAVFDPVDGIFRGYSSRAPYLGIKYTYTTKDSYGKEFDVNVDISYALDNDFELVQEGGEWRYYKKGKWGSDRYGFVNHDGGIFLVANGVVANLSGVVPYGNAFYCLSGGQVQTQYTGLVQYDGEWFYVENGVLASGFNGIQDYDGSKFLVALGRVLYSYSGLYQDADGTWYYIANGQVQTQYTGLAQYDGAWFYIQNGVLAVNYSGWVEYDGAAFQVVNGSVIV